MNMINKVMLPEFKISEKFRNHSLMIKRTSFRTKPKKSIIQLDSRTGSSNVITQKKKSQLLEDL